MTCPKCGSDKQHMPSIGYGEERRRYICNCCGAMYIEEWSKLFVYGMHFNLYTQYSKCLIEINEEGEYK